MQFYMARLAAGGIDSVNESHVLHPGAARFISPVCSQSKRFAQRSKAAARRGGHANAVSATYPRRLRRTPAPSAEPVCPIFPRASGDLDYQARPLPMLAMISNEHYRA